MMRKFIVLSLVAAFVASHAFVASAQAPSQGPGWVPMRAGLTQQHLAAAHRRCSLLALPHLSGAAFGSSENMMQNLITGLSTMTLCMEDRGWTLQD